MESELLHEFLEWLDYGQQLVRSPEESNGDTRSWDQLVEQFLAQR